MIMQTLCANVIAALFVIVLYNEQGSSTCNSRALKYDATFYIPVVFVSSTPYSIYNLQDTHGDDLLSATFNGILKSVNIRPDEIGDICIGNVNDGRASVTARFAQFYR